VARLSRHHRCDCCATFRDWKRKHLPMLTALQEGRTDDYHRMSGQLEERSEVHREAVALCVECHNPMIATEHGFHQFCPYERAGQHEKLKRARTSAKPVLSVISARPLTELLPKESSEQERASDRSVAQRRGAGKRR
jgi:hypothetical protein